MKWKKVKLGQLCKMNSGGTPRRNNHQFYGGHIPWAKIGDIENACNGYIYVTEENITEEGLGSIGNRLFSEGTLLLAMYGSVGKTAFAGVPLSTNQAILGIKVLDQKILDRRYLKFWFDSIKDKLLDRAVGGTLQNISLGIVKDLEIPLPPLHTQEQIADTLDKADTLRRKDQELLEKYDQLAQSIFYDMFGDPVRNEKGWEIRTLDELSLKVADIDHNMPKAVEKGVPFISAKDLIDDGKISFDTVKYISESDYAKLSRKIKPEYGDILYSRIGAKLGKARKVTTRERFLVSYSCCTIKPNTNLVNTDYLCSFLDSPFCLQEVFKKVRSIGVPDLGMDEVRNINVPYPDLKIQEIYAKKISTIKLCKENVLNNTSTDLFNALNVDYFS
jgi:type I restriction enzyme S subunit